MSSRLAASLGARLLARSAPSAAGCGAWAAAGRPVTTASRPTAAPPAVPEPAAASADEDAGVVPSRPQQRWLRELGVIRNDWT